MITVDKELEVLWLLRKTNLSRAAIARKVGIDPKTVNKIIMAGKPRARVGVASTEALTPQGVTAYRCLGCGYLVKLSPCLICRTEEEKAQKRLLTAPRGPES